MFSLYYLGGQNPGAGTRLVGRKFSLFWSRIQVGQQSLRTCLHSLCSFLSFTLWGCAPLTSVCGPIRHALLRTFSCVVTSTSSILPGLDLAASFAILFPALMDPGLRKAFLDYLCWIVANCPSQFYLPTFSTLFCVLWGNDRLPFGFRMLGWREVRVLILWAPSLMSCTLLRATVNRMLPATTDSLLLLLC